MKTETIEQFLKRGGVIKKPKANYKTEKYYYSWITRGKLKLKKKKNDSV